MIENHLLVEERMLVLLLIQLDLQVDGLYAFFYRCAVRTLEVLRRLVVALDERLNRRGCQSVALL